MQGKQIGKNHRQISRERYENMMGRFRCSSS